MKQNAKDNADRTREQDSLATADAVARTARIWIRSICLSEKHEEAERYALASGLIAGLCERLDLNARVRELVTYVYTLLGDEGGRALIVSRMMLDKPESTSLRDAYERGRSEATGIIEMLALHDQK
jgi:hypothetical protein